MEPHFGKRPRLGGPAVDEQKPGVGHDAAGNIILRSREQASERPVAADLKPGGGEESAETLLDLAIGIEQVNDGFAVRRPLLAPAALDRRGRIRKSPEVGSGEDC
jgi:hypothetical protein